MTNIDRVKCDKFLEDHDKHFREKKILNFDIIYKRIRDEKVPESDLKRYQTVQDSRLKQYPQKNRDKFLSVAFRTDRKDLYFEKEIVRSRFSSLSKR